MTTTFNEVRTVTFRYNNNNNNNITFDFTSAQIQTIEPPPAATIPSTPPPDLIQCDQNIIETIKGSSEKRRCPDIDENVVPKTLTVPSKASAHAVPKKSRHSIKSGRYARSKNVSFPIISPIGPIECLPTLPANHHANSNSDRVLPEWYNATVPLGVEDDRSFLQGLHTYVRSHLVEVFGTDEKCVEKAILTSVRPSSPSPSSTTTTTIPKKGPSKIGQIGIRCRYCHGTSSSSSDDTAITFPSKISEFYQCAQYLFTDHFPVCPHVPPSVRDEVKTLQEEDLENQKGNLVPGIVEVYWEDSARMLGMVNVGGGNDGGVYFGRDSNKGTFPKLRGITAAYMAQMAQKSMNTDTEQEMGNAEGKLGLGLSTTGDKPGLEEMNEDVGNTEIKQETVNTEVDSGVSTTGGKAGQEETNEDVENTDTKQETEVDGVVCVCVMTGQEERKKDMMKHAAGRSILMKIPAIPYIYAGGDTDYSAGNVPIDVTHVVVLDSVTHIDGCAFQNCTFLASIHISDSVSSIGVRAFEGCSNLTSVRLPPGLRCIGHEAFSGCLSLVDLRLPDSLARIEDRAFYRCESLTTVYTVVDTDNVVMGDALGVGGERCRYLPKDHYLDFTAQVASNVHSLGKDAFTKCTSLTKVTLPSCIGTLGERAFFDCAALKSVRLPKSLIGFPVDAFEGCTVLDTIDGLGSSLTQWSKSSSTIHIIPDDDSDDTDESDDDDTDITPQLRLRKALTAAGYSTFNLSNFLNLNSTPSSQPATHYYHTSIWYAWACLASPANGRIPLMTAVAEPCSDWTSVAKIFEKNMPGLYGIDREVSGLSPFALAAAGKEGDLEVAFRLLREYPPAIMMMMENNDDNNNNCDVVVVVDDDDDVEDMDWD